MLNKGLIWQIDILNFWEKEVNKKHFWREKKWYLNFNILV